MQALVIPSGEFLQKSGPHWRVVFSGLGFSDFGFTGLRVRVLGLQVSGSRLKVRALGV